MKKILVIDNYDSFVFNIVQLLKEAEEAPYFEVVRNDEIDFSSLDGYGGLLLSPGPGLPAEAGDLIPLVRKCARSHSVLGICLGHQAIAEAFGGSLLHLPAPLHGHCSILSSRTGADPLLAGAMQPVKVGRYHSWVVNPVNLPDCLEVTSRDEEGHIMSLRHRSLRIFGVQYHPESYMSTCGRILIDNWLKTV